jgi:hypothetical protein
VFRVIDAGEEVYYANTDCVMIKSEMRGMLTEGTGLGEFKIEDECIDFICLKAKTRMMVLKDGREKTSSKHSWAWFVIEAEKMSARKEVMKAREEREREVEELKRVTYERRQKKWSEEK